ncbi:DoxX family membrane protein [Sinorhizobium meliloti]|nr:DoxX family membrane protein [Sinorhizobium meliloti]
MNERLKSAAEPIIAHHPGRWFALLALCAPFIHGSIARYFDFNSAVAEMERHRLFPAAPYAAASIFLWMTLSLLVLSGFLRWIAALVLALFALSAAFAAPSLSEAFFGQVAIAGGLLLVAWEDLRGSNDD